MKLRIPDADLEIGDVAVHGEEAYPSDELVRVAASVAAEPLPPASPETVTPETTPATKEPPNP
jgi:Amt family ammonium transporter